ncbi:MAG: hypothetical protein AMXMBFR7_26230 [Planctomycetota bacterium]
MSQRSNVNAFSAGTQDTGLDYVLARALALGGKPSSELQRVLDEAQRTLPSGGWQAVALKLTGLSVAEDAARQTFERLLAHRADLERALGRPVHFKTAAMDGLDRAEAQAGQAPASDAGLSYDQLVQMAFRDHLTGLENFRSFTRRYQQEIRRADRYKHLCSVLMLDLDRFKHFNDTFGHESGNAALRHLASILRAQTRETDVVARYGGEEFVVILPETAKHEAARLAEELRRAIEAAPVDLKDAGRQPLTVSVGLATYPRDARDAQTLLERSDEALYRAKENGRNRLEQCQPDSVAALRYRPEHPAAAQSVHVVGDFNGWDRTIDPMPRDAAGTFALELRLAPGRYVYKFVINGEWYMPDPQATEYDHDGFGGRNSVLWVK